MPKPHIVTGLDIGSGFIKVMAATKKPKGEDFEVLGLEQEVSSGIRKGVVIDVPKVAGIASYLIKKLEQDCGQKIESVYAGVGGGHIFSTSSRGLVSVSRADQKISEDDIERVLLAAQTFPLASNSEIIETFPKEFIVDGQKGIREALGMQGVRLEAEVLMLCGFSPYLRNSSQAILSAGLHLNDLIPTPLASSRSILTPREKELGVVVLDIGNGTTDMAVFEEGSLIYATVFPVGSGHITNDIAICLKTDIDTAEKIKLEFGPSLSHYPGAQKSLKSEKKIRVEGEEPLIFSKKILAEIIQARIEEIFELTGKELKKISRQGRLPAGIVITGGGAKISGIKDIAKRELKLPCRIGVAKEFPSLAEDPALSTLCGLVVEGAFIEEDEGRNFSGWGARFRSGLKKIFRSFIP